MAEGKTGGLVAIAVAVIGAVGLIVSNAVKTKLPETSSVDSGERRDPPVALPADSPDKTLQAASTAYKSEQFLEAARLYEKAAAGGNAEAMYSLGRMYFKGQGVTKDTGQARKWWEKAASAGYSEAMYQLGLQWHKGEFGTGLRAGTNMV